MVNVPGKAAIKELKFRGSSRHDLREFLEGARQHAGYQLDRSQNGLERLRNLRSRIPQNGVPEAKALVPLGGYAGTKVPAYLKNNFEVPAFLEGKFFRWTVPI